jgi:hypothetical protein
MSFSIGLDSHIEDRKQEYFNYLSQGHVEDFTAAGHRDSDF